LREYKERNRKENKVRRRHQIKRRICHRNIKEEAEDTGSYREEGKGRKS
jgi:hypothetical protein